MRKDDVQCGTCSYTPSMFYYVIWYSNIFKENIGYSSFFLFLRRNCHPHDIDKLVFCNKISRAMKVVLWKLYFIFPTTSLPSPNGLEWKRAGTTYNTSPHCCCIPAILKQRTTTSIPFQKHVRNLSNKDENILFHKEFKSVFRYVMGKYFFPDVSVDVSVNITRILGLIEIYRR